MENKPYDACPDCGSHESFNTAFDGILTCACGWKGSPEDCTYRVSLEQIERAHERGEEALALLREIVKDEKEFEA